MIIELKNKFIRKNDFRVVEIHEKFRSIILKISIDIHDFVVKFRIYNDDLTIIHNDYVFRKWEMNFHFVNHFIDVYDFFIIDFFIANNDFIKIDKKMNWQIFVNKIAKIEFKIKFREIRVIVYKIICIKFCCDNKKISAMIANIFDFLNKYMKIKKIAILIRKNIKCDVCEKMKHLNNECWDKVEILEHIKRKRTKTFEKKIKKIKTNYSVAVSINSEFVKNFDENVLTCSIMLRNYFVKNKRFMLKKNVVEKKKIMFVCSIMISIYTFSKISKNHHYYIDFEVDRHINDNKSDFFFLVKLNKSITIFDFNEKNVVINQNTLKIRITINDKYQIIMIHNVLYVFNLSFNLFSVKTFERKNLKTTFKKKICRIAHIDIQQIFVIEINVIDTNLYRLIFVDDIFFEIHFVVYHAVVRETVSITSKFTTSFFSFSLTIVKSSTCKKIKKIHIDVVHKRIEHLSKNHLKRLSNVIEELKLIDTLSFCEKCALIKQIRRNFIKQFKRYTIFDDRIHLNVNEFHSISMKKKRYFLLCMNEIIKFRWMFFLKQKSNVSRTIKQFITMMKIQSNHKIKRWHFDNEKKFIFNIITNIVKFNEIMHKFTIFYNSKQNEFAKKSMHTI